jgi:hypothetical protein
MRESGPNFSTPSDGYAVEREQDGRVLFSYDVDGRTKVSMFAAQGVRDWSGDEGWGVRTWAQCDPSELPRTSPTTPTSACGSTTRADACP